MLLLTAAVGGTFTGFRSVTPLSAAAFFFSTAALDFAFTCTVTRCFGAFTLVSATTFPVRRARVTTHAFSRLGAGTMIGHFEGTSISDVNLADPFFSKI